MGVGSFVKKGRAQGDSSTIQEGPEGRARPSCLHAVWLGLPELRGGASGLEERVSEESLGGSWKIGGGERERLGPPGKGSHQLW